MQYGVQGSGSTQTLSVSGGNVNESTISGLTPSTNYSIEVAAVTGEDRIGVYSSSISEETDGENYCGTRFWISQHNIIHTHNYS